MDLENRYDFVDLDELDKGHVRLLACRSAIKEKTIYLTVGSVGGTEGRGVDPAESTRYVT